MNNIKIKLKTSELLPCAVMWQANWVMKSKRLRN
jgi:hypothetical protein